MLTKYMTPRSRRTDNRTLQGRFRGGKLCPVMAVPFKPSEGGTVTQSLAVELDQLAGRMITEVTLHVVSVFVPALAIDAMDNPDADYPGNAEIFRQKMMGTTGIFGFQDPNDLTRQMGIKGKRVNGAVQVSRSAMLAHNSAVNFLRRSKYVDAAQVVQNNKQITPALIGQTVLDRFNAVLDPEDRVNGAVTLTGKIPVRGLGRKHTTYSNTPDLDVLESEGGVTVYNDFADTSNPLDVVMKVTSSGRPDVWVDFSETNQTLSLQDFYTAERMDELTRQMRKLVDDNPEYGEDLVARVSHGLQVEPDKQPFVVYEREQVFTNAMQRAMDGASLDQTASNLATTVDFTVPIPMTEFGGVLITFCSVKPDETLHAQPHPVFAKDWFATNHLADELAVDPVPVTMRDIDSDVAQADENTIVFYTANNELYRNYNHYGFTENTDLTTVESKSALWQIKVPPSVTPESVIYPDEIDHYPWGDQTVDIALYTVRNRASIQTPMMYGPSPVEELAVLDTKDLFEEGV